MVGGDAPVVVESMTKTDTSEIGATVDQLHRMAEVGCELARVAIPDGEAASCFGRIRSKSPIPLVPDIHFDYRLALQVLDEGADGIRINPGNIGGKVPLERIAKAVLERKVSLRVGVNAGSLEKSVYVKHGGATPLALAKSTVVYVRWLEDFGVRDLILSAKSNSVPVTIEAYRILSQVADYPLHIGITEAGLATAGVIKSAVGLGILLHEGIGDCLRVSLTSPPEDEVRVGYEILKSLSLRQKGPILVSCPTCGRCQVELQPIAEEVDRALQEIDAPIAVAVMGCEVNGPGEAREADVGLACGKKSGLIFRNGEVVRKVSHGEMVAVLLQEVHDFLDKSSA
jgi:(E)-4-hydroxy-3-methylbut-2-enyl-diphosphate synthase